MKLKPFLIMGTIVFTIMIFYVWWLKTLEPIPQSQITQKVEEIQKPPTKPPLVVPELIKKINARNKSITSIYCDNVKVKVWKNGSRYKISGSMYYEKPTKFRLKISSIMGDELDLGSNNKLFWYWSRRDKDPGLHYAKHEDYNKTRLKSGFNPRFMMRSLGIAEIVINEKTKVVETEKDWIIVHRKKNASGKPILVSIFFSKAKEVIDGIIVTDMNGKPHASADIQGHQNGLPTKILYVWHTENQALLLEFRKVRVNQRISSQKWRMPNKKPQLNMADD